MAETASKNRTSEAAGETVLEITVVTSHGEILDGIAVRN
jgi:hypothetical protein